uniref:Glutamate decarboxylase n=1 Tax=Phlebotomus papatasi TaxID=29031 RepID=A0A1B0GQ37_PHLPP
MIYDILPHQVTAGPETKEFLLKVIDILLDFIRATNDRNEKVLDFHHPEEMKKLLQLEIPDNPVSLQQLLADCATTLKYQVKTGKLNCY